MYCNMVYNMVCYGLLRYGKIWFLYGMVLFVIANYYMVCCGNVRNGKNVWFLYDIVWYVMI